MVFSDVLDILYTAMYLHPTQELKKRTVSSLFSLLMSDSFTLVAVPTSPSEMNLAFLEKLFPKLNIFYVCHVIN
jgi:hypothetical protein